MSPPPEPFGALLISAWVEVGSATPLHARITGAQGSAEQVATTVATIDEVCDTVRAWLEELIATAAGR